MKPEEKKYLKMTKTSNNYNNSEADDSISNFIDSQKQFKILNKENKKKDTIIKNLLNQVEKLKQRLLKKQKPVLNIKNSNTQKGKEIFLADITEEEYKINKASINRIQRHLEINRDYTKTDIKKELFINYKKRDFCLGYLLNKGIITDSIINNTIKYRLSD